MIQNEQRASIFENVCYSIAFANQNQVISPGKMFKNEMIEGRNIRLASYVSEIVAGPQRKRRIHTSETNF